MFKKGICKKGAPVSCNIHYWSTNKTAIHNYMVKDQNFQPQTAVIDAMFLLKSSLPKLPGTLSAIATLILQKALSLTKHWADLRFDALCVKSVRIRSYFDPHFPTFGLNTKRFSV